MNIFSRLKCRVVDEAFQPTWLSAVFSPVFIVRNELFKAVRGMSENIKGNILDFGCGSKPYENLFLHTDSYLGCDIEVSGHDHKDSCIDYFFDGEKLPFQSENFDAVVSFEVFEHVFDLPNVLKEINRVTKQGGGLLISVPFVWEEHEAPFDFARYTSFGLKHMLRESGYEVVEFRKTGSYTLVVFQVFIVYLSKNIFPNGRLRKIFQVIIGFPLTMFAYLLHFILPNNQGLFCGSVVLAKKVQ